MDLSNFEYMSSMAESKVTGIIKSLNVLEENDLRSITFPAISTGIYGYPKEEAAETMINAILGYIK